LGSEPREDVLEMDERRLLQSEARGEQVGDCGEGGREEKRKNYYQYML